MSGFFLAAKLAYPLSPSAADGSPRRCPPGLAGQASFPGPVGTRFTVARRARRRVRRHNDAARKRPAKASAAGSNNIRPPTWLRALTSKDAGASIHYADVVTMRAFMLGLDAGGRPTSAGAVSARLPRALERRCSTNDADACLITKLKITRRSRRLASSNRLSHSTSAQFEQLGFKELGASPCDVPSILPAASKCHTGAQSGRTARPRSRGPNDRRTLRKEDLSDDSTRDCRVRDRNPRTDSDLDTSPRKIAKSKTDQASPWF